MTSAGWLVRLRTRLIVAAGLFGASASAQGPSTAVPASGVLVGSVGELSNDDQLLLTELLNKAGIKQAKVRSVERTPERQVRVMLNLAIEDLDAAKAMYCQAGDEVLSHFDPKATREQNQTTMLQALVAALPKAREIGCLNHIRNDEVVSVDVGASELSSEQQAALIKVAEAAVAAKRIERFLAPPREPEAFHFEFRRTRPTATADVASPGVAAPDAASPDAASAGAASADAKKSQGAK